MGEISTIQSTDGATYYLRDRNFASCSTAASTSTKSVTITGLGLVAGAKINIQFQNANTASNPTLSINGGVEHSIIAHNLPNGVNWVAGSIVELVFDGTNWIAPGLVNPVSLQFYYDEDGDLCQVDGDL